VFKRYTERWPDGRIGMPTGASRRKRRESGCRQSAASTSEADVGFGSCLHPYLHPAPARRPPRRGRVAQQRPRAASRDGRSRTRTGGFLLVSSAPQAAVRRHSPPLCASRRTTPPASRRRSPLVSGVARAPARTLSGVCVTARLTFTLIKHGRSYVRATAHGGGHLTVNGRDSTSDDVNITEPISFSTR
jgi:hypothetical protein